MSTPVLDPVTHSSRGRADLTRHGWKVWLLAPVGIFLVGRLISSTLMVVLAQGHPEPTGAELSPLPDPRSPLNLHARWDAQWYERIVEDGYPRTLPRDTAGQVVENQWAFLPGFPVLAGLLVRLGLAFPVAGIAVSLVLGAVAMVLLFRMLARAGDAFTATVTVTALSFSPASLTFGLPYSESLALALILTCLTLLGAGRPVAFLVAALALSLSRPVAPALAAVVGVVWLARWFRRERTPFPVRERVVWAAVAVLTASFFLIWPAITGLVTGEWNAYALTQKAWLPEVDGWSTWLSLGLKGEPELLVTFLVLFGGLLVALRYARSWPLTLRAWAVLYPLFILGASRPTSSVVRYLTLTAATAWPVPDLSGQCTSVRSRALLLGVVVVVGTAVQALWIQHLWLSEQGIFP